MVKTILRSIAAALTTPEAITAEKSLLVIVLARLAITLPAYAWVIDEIVKAIQ